MHPFTASTFATEGAEPWGDDMSKSCSSSGTDISLPHDTLQKKNLDNSGEEQRGCLFSRDLFSVCVYLMIAKTASGCPDVGFGGNEIS